jgi:hypothetical protein
MKRNEIAARRTHSNNASILSRIKSPGQASPEEGNTHSRGLMDARCRARGSRCLAGSIRASIVAADTVDTEGSRRMINSKVMMQAAATTLPAITARSGPERRELPPASMVRVRMSADLRTGASDLGEGKGVSKGGRCEGKRRAGRRTSPGAATFSTLKHRYPFLFPGSNAEYHVCSDLVPRCQTTLIHPNLRRTLPEQGSQPFWPSSRVISTWLKFIDSLQG